MISKIWLYLQSPFLDVDTKSSTKGKNLQILDGIRGLAVLIVIASHTNAFRMYGQGSLGVMLFFCLSGIVLIIPFAENPRRMLGRRELSLYFFNRVCRIVPLYLVMVGGIALYLNQNFEWYLWNVSFVRGWNHLWSVAEEVRFYLLLPIVVVVMAICNNRYVSIGILAILIYFFFEYRYLHIIDMMNGRKVHFYFFMFLSGALAYMLSILPVVEKYMKGPKVQRIFSVTAFIILLTFLFSSNEMVKLFWRPIFDDLPKNFSLNGWVRPGTWMVLFSLFFFSLIVYSQGVTYKILNSYLLRHIGLLSYSLYLSHMIIRGSFYEAGFRNEGLFISTFFGSYLLALFTYVAIEKPFLQLKKVIVNRT